MSNNDLHEKDAVETRKGIIKCAACGVYWNEGIAFLFHPKGNCPLADVGMCRSQIVSVNAAIEAARKTGNSFSWTQKITDPRKPEECKHLDPDFELEFFCGEHHMFCKGVCPCAGWAKKEE